MATLFSGSFMFTSTKSATSKVPTISSSKTSVKSAATIVGTSAAEIEILGAYYVTTYVTKDATSFFLKNLAARLVFSPSNFLSSIGLATDLRPGKNKTLSILYTYGGSKRIVSVTPSSARCTITSTRGGSLAVTIPSCASKPSEQRHHRRGDLRRPNDVNATLWNKIHAQAAGLHWFQVTRTFFGSINPMSNQSKLAIV